MTRGREIEGLGRAVLEAIRQLEQEGERPTRRRILYRARVILSSDFSSGPLKATVTSALEAGLIEPAGGRGTSWEPHFFKLTAKGEEMLDGEGPGMIAVETEPFANWRT